MSEIEFRHVRKSYGKNQIVHGISLEAALGEFLVILGPSGCGKSTLLRMVAGLEPITSGEIAIGGRVVNALEPRERGCAMVFQNYALYPHMTVAENIGYSLRIAGVARDKRKAKVGDVAELLGLTELLDRKPGQLSGGQRQRVAMGRAMIREPKVFLYDEPLSNLDARLRVAMRMEIRKLHQRLGTTTLFVTHDQVEAMTLADRIVVMNKGVVEQVGTPSEVYDQPASTYVAEFIGAPGLNLMAATADPASATVALSDGQRIAYDARQWPYVPAGPVTVGFRAEKTHVAQSGLKGRLDFTEELGAARQFHCLIAGQTVIAMVASSDRYETGQALALAVDPGDVHLFEFQSGKRLREGLVDRTVSSTSSRATVNA